MDHRVTWPLLIFQMVRNYGSKDHMESGESMRTDTTTEITRLTLVKASGAKEGFHITPKFNKPSVLSND